MLVYSFNWTNHCLYIHGTGQIIAYIFIELDKSLLVYSCTWTNHCFYICSKCPTQTHINPGTTEILLTFNVNTRLQWTINTTGRNLQLLCFNEGQLWMSTGTQDLNLSMSQLFHNPHGYNPLNYHCHYHWTWSHKLSISIVSLMIV